MKTYRPDLYYVVPALYAQRRECRDLRTAQALAGVQAISDDGSVWYVVQHVSSHSLHDVGPARPRIKHVPMGNQNHGKRKTRRVQP